MNHESRLHQHQDETLHPSESARHDVREFATPDDALRQDRQQVAVPPRVTQRLAASLDAEPHPPTSWWRKLLRRSGVHVR